MVCYILCDPHRSSGWLDEKGVNLTDFFSLSADEQSARLTALARNALTEWGVTSCEPRLIKYRENAVYEVTTADGARAALRVHRQGYHSDDSLASELKWMAMLADGGLVVPTPVPTASGSIVFNGRADDVPGVWNVDMLTWLEGRVLGAVGEPLDYEGLAPDDLFREIGKTIGALHNLSTAWPVQNAMIRHSWDRDGLVGEEPLWGQFWKLAALTPDQKILFLKAKTAIAEDLDTYGQTTDNYGLIHADLVPDNVLLSGDEIQLIDFDDAGFGWHMFEIVTAIFWLAEEPAFDIIRSSLLEGYQSVRPLLQRDLDSMNLFFTARSLTYLGWVHTRQNTETAIELTPIMVEIAAEICSDYLERCPTSFEPVAPACGVT